MTNRFRIAALVALALGGTGAMANVTDADKQQAKDKPDMRVADQPSQPMSDARLDYRVGSSATVQSDLKTQKMTAAQADTAQPRTAQTGATAKKSADGARNAKSKAAPAGSGDAMTYGLLVVPFAVASDDSLNNGCWARLYENPNFGGSHLTIVGPLDVNSLKGSVASDWNGADSIITGRSARVTAYDNRNFGDRVASIGPNQRNASMTGPFQKIQSLKVTCQGQG